MQHKYWLDHRSMGNFFGHSFKMVTFGESHGEGLGVVIEGCPSQIPFDFELLKSDLNERRPGQSDVVTSRQELDLPQVLSGVFEGRTLGTPIAILVKNQDQRSEDYKDIKHTPRPGHADDVWKTKYGHVDHRGGGRASGRETVARVMAGSVAKMYLRERCPHLNVLCFVAQIGEEHLSEEEILAISKRSTRKDIYASKVRVPLEDMSQKMEDLLLKAKSENESFGGLIQVIIKNPPSGLGEPVFNKIKSQLAQAYLSIGACNGFDFGKGFEGASMKGSEYHKDNPHFYGGIRGGLTTGEDIFARLSFKPTSSINSIAQKGRHDPCILPRAVSVVESMTYLVLADLYSLKK